MAMLMRAMEREEREEGTSLMEQASPPSSFFSCIFWGSHEQDPFCTHSYVSVGGLLTYSPFCTRTSAAFSQEEAFPSKDCSSSVFSHGNVKKCSYHPFEKVM